MQQRPAPAEPHARHDALLVAALAADDLAAGDLDRATSLVAGCAACAALHRDLRAIASALPAAAAPRRPRDFRLSAGQAAALRPTGRRRLLAALAGPRFTFAVPFGTGLAAAAVAVLVATGALLPFAGSGAAMRSGADGAGDAVAPSARQEQVELAAGTSLDPAVAPDGGAPLGSALPLGSAQAPDAVPGASSPGLEAPAAGSADAAAGSGEAGTPLADVVQDAAPVVEPAAVAAWLALALGLLLVAGRVAARRLPGR